MSKAIFLLSVKVVPKSARNEIVGWENEELKVKLNATPEKGEANAELIAFLAKRLRIAKSHIELISGEKSRHKKLAIHGISQSDLEEII